MRLFQLHLGREVSIYALYGTVAAKVNLINCENVFPSGERRICPDETANDQQRVMKIDAERIRTSSTKRCSNGLNNTTIAHYGLLY